MRLGRAVGMVICLALVAMSCAERGEDPSNARPPGRPGRPRPVAVVTLPPDDVEPGVDGTVAPDSRSRARRLRVARRRLWPQRGRRRDPRSRSGRGAGALVRHHQAHHDRRSRFPGLARAQPGDLRRRRGLRGVVQRGRAASTASRSNSRLRDAKLTDYQPVLEQACAEDFAVVGDGAVQDNLWADVGRACGLIDIAGFSVTAAKAGVAGDDPVETRQVQPVPNPADEVAIGANVILSERVPRHRRPHRAHLRGLPDPGESVREGAGRVRGGRSHDHPHRRLQHPGRGQLDALRRRDPGCRCRVPAVHRRTRQRRPTEAGARGDRVLADRHAPGDELLRPQLPHRRRRCRRGGLHPHRVLALRGGRPEPGHPGLPGHRRGAGRQGRHPRRPVDVGMAALRHAGQAVRSGQRPESQLCARGRRAR